MDAVGRCTIARIRDRYVRTCDPRSGQRALFAVTAIRAVAALHLANLIAFLATAGADFPLAVAGIFRAILIGCSACFIAA